MQYLKTIILASCLTLIPATALAGWGGQIGSWLTNVPLIDAVGNRILENRIAYIRTSLGYPEGTIAQVDPALGSRVNVRSHPNTGAGSEIITRLNPGDKVEVVANVPGAPWIRVSLGVHKHGFIYRKLVVLSTVAQPEVSD